MLIRINLLPLELLQSLKQITPYSFITTDKSKVFLTEEDYDFLKENSEGVIYIASHNDLRFSYNDLRFNYSVIRFGRNVAGNWLMSNSYNYRTSGLDGECFYLNIVPYKDNTGAKDEDAPF